MAHRFKVRLKKSRENHFFFHLIQLVVDCKKRLFDDDDWIEKHEDIQERTSVKKQKITCT
jgi:hypothetical protein